MPATLKQIADSCGVSTATVSRALAGGHYVRPALRERIIREARRLGYSPNRLVGSLMAHVRNSRIGTFHGSLALVHVRAPGVSEIGSQLQRIITSAQNRASELGFSTQVFELGETVREEAALVRVLRARGMVGAAFFYPGPSEAPRTFPWHEFASVALDFAQRNPKLDTICHDHYVTLRAALASLAEMGYKRIGLFIERFKDERTDDRWSAALLSYQHIPGGIGHVPPLSPAVITESGFLRWFEEHRPDLVAGHYDDAISWLRVLRLGVPKHVGFFNLNWEARTVACAGVDPQLELQGRVAAEVLVARVQRGEKGLPETPRLISVPGRLVDGPTVVGPALARTRVAPRLKR